MSAVQEYKLFIQEYAEKIITSTNKYIGTNTIAKYNFGILIDSVSTSNEVSLEKLTFKKRLYHPCEIHSRININSIVEIITKEESGISMTETLYHLPSYDIIKTTFFRQIVTLMVGDDTVASNYYVHKIRPTFQKTCVKLDLTIYSLDKLMDIDKHSTAYTAKQLGLDILTDEAKNYKLDTLSVPVSIAPQFLKNSDSSELRIPYAVQYNESFYDFMVRMANRYGEFLFFEDGQLQLGLDITDTAHTTNQNTDYSSKADEYYYESVITDAVEVEDCYYPYLDRVNSDYLCYAGDVNFSSKSLKTLIPSTESNPNPKIESTEKEGSKDKFDVKITTCYEEGTKVESGVQDKNGKWEKGYPEVSYNKPESTTTTEDTKRHFYLNDPIPADEYLDIIKKDGYTNYNKQFWRNWRKTLFSCISTAMRDTNLYDMILDLAIQEIMHSIHAEYSVIELNRENNETNIDPWLDVKNSDQTDGDKSVAQFSTLADSTTLKTTINSFSNYEVQKLTSIFYSVIRKVEKEVGHDAVWLNFGTTYQHLKLGDLIKVGGKQYIVAQVECVVNIVETTDENGSSNNASSNDASGSDASGESGSGDNGTETQVTSQNNVMAIPLYKDVQACPPALPGVAIRKAQPQQAFVDASLDPQRLGRVRIRYPWQKSTGDASPWLRVALPMATAGAGVNFTPSTGDEVMVGYEEGNIDRPYVIGYLQSKYCTEKWGALPDKGIVSKNGHSLLFDDPSYANGFFAGICPILPFIETFFPHFGLLETENQDLLALSGGITLTDRYGLYNISASTDDRSIKIASPWGDVSLNAFTGITISAPNGDISIVGKNIKIAASNKIDIVSGKNVQEKYLPFLGLDNKRNGFEQFGLTLAERVVSDLADQLINLKFLRTIYETFVRPVDGTMKIKSYTFLQMEAGDGMSEIPADMYRKKPSDSAIVKNVIKPLDMLTAAVNKKVEDFVTALGPMYTAFATFKADIAKTQVTVDKDIIANPNKDGEAIAFDAIKDVAMTDDGGKDLEDAKFTFDATKDIWKEYEAKQYTVEEPVQGTKEDKKDFDKRHKDWEDAKKQFEDDEKKKVDDQNQKIEARKQYVKDQANALRTSMYNAYLLAKDLNAPALVWTGPKKAPFKTEATEAFKKIYDAADTHELNKLIAAIKGHSGDVKIDDSLNGKVADKEEAMKLMKKRVAYEYLQQLRNNTDFKKYFEIKASSNNLDVTKSIPDDDWNNYMENIIRSQTTSTSSFGDEAKALGKSSGKNMIHSMIDPFIAFDPRSPWSSTEMKGKILMSDTPGKTINFNSGVLQANENVVNISDKVLDEIKKKFKGV